jgi:hypothetical protein
MVTLSAFQQEIHQPIWAKDKPQPLALGYPLGASPGGGGGEEETARIVIVRLSPGGMKQ